MTSYERAVSCLLVFGLLLIGGAARLAAAEPPADDAVASGLKAAEECWRSNNWAGVVGILEPLAPKAVGDARELYLWTQLGNGFSRLNRPDSAAPAFERAAGLQKDENAARNLRFQASDEFVRAGMPLETMRILDGLLAKNPEPAVKGGILQRRAYVLRQNLGKPAEALTAFREARQAYDAAGDARGSWSTALNIGDLLYDTDKSQAVAHYRAELTTRTDKGQRAELYRRLCRLLQEMQDQDGPLKLIETAAAEYRDSAEFGNGRPFTAFADELAMLKSQVLWDAGKADEARKRLADQVAQAPAEKKWAVTMEAAGVLRRWKLPEESFGLYEGLYPLAADDAGKRVVFRELAHAYAEAKKRDDAWGALKKLSGNGPALVPAYEELLGMYARTGGCPAEKDVEYALEMEQIAPDNAKRLEYGITAARALWRVNRMKAAVEKLARIEPELKPVADPAVATGLRKQAAQAWFDMQHAERAEKLWAELIEAAGGADKADYDMLYGRGRCLEALGRMAEAAVSYRRAVAAAHNRWELEPASGGWQNCSWMAGNLTPTLTALKQTLAERTDPRWYLQSREDIVRAAELCCAHGLKRRALEQIIERTQGELRAVEKDLVETDAAARSAAASAKTDADKLKAFNLQKQLRETQGQKEDLTNRLAGLERRLAAAKPKAGGFRVEMPTLVIYRGDPAGFDLYGVNADDRDLADVKIGVELGGTPTAVEVGGLSGLLTVKTTIRPTAKQVGSPGRKTLAVTAGALGSWKVPVVVKDVPKPVRVDLAGKEEFVLKAEEAGVWNMAKESSGTNRPAVWAIGKDADTGVADFFLDVPHACRVVVEASCVVTDGRHPQALVLQLDGGGPRRWYEPQNWNNDEAIGMTRELPVYELSAGLHRFRAIVRNPTHRLERIVFRPEFKYRLAARIAAEAQADDGIFYDGDKAKFNVEVCNLREGAMSWQGALEILDPNGKPVVSRDVKAVAAGGMAWAGSMETLLEKHGVLRACAVTKTDIGVLSAEYPFATIFRPAEGFKFHSPYAVDSRSGGALAMASRIGVKWTRFTLAWGPVEPVKGQYNWDAFDALARDMRKTTTYGQVQISYAPPWAIAWPGGWVPGHRRGDRSPSPDHYGDYEEFCYQVAKRYGDVFKLFFVMNEPWEGGSISGWDSNGQHLRNLIKAMYKGVHRAEKELWPEPKSDDQRLMVGGVDGDANNFDNLLTEQGMENFYDVFTVHTWDCNRLSEYFLHGVAKQMGKPIYDTESWNGAADILKTWCFDASRGGVQCAPLDAGGLMGTGKIGRNGVLVSTWLHFLEDTKFHKEVNPQCMPYMFLFKSDDNRKKVAVVFGRPRNPLEKREAAAWSGPTYDRESVSCIGAEWDQIKVDGEMVLEDPAGEFRVYDEYGNPVEKRGKNWVIRLTAPEENPERENDFYVTTTGDIDRLGDALAKAKLSGITPVQIELDDFTRPLNEKPDLVVRVANALNEPLSGTVSVETEGGIRLAETEKTFAGLESGRKTELRFKTADGTRNQANFYPVKVLVKTDRGEAVHREGLSVACMVKGTPKIDGDIGEWEKLGAIPVYLHRKRLGDPWASARYMWMEIPQYKEGGEDFAQAACMWDEKNFYMMMKIKTGGDFKLPSMRNINYEMYPRPAEYVYKRPYWPRGRIQIGFDCIPNAGKDLLGLDPNSPTFRRYAFPDTDYRYFLYAIEGGAEVWRSLAPGARYDDWYPFSPPPPKGTPPQMIVEDARLAFKHDEKSGVWFMECAIPLSELAELKPEPGKQVGFMFEVAGIGHWSEGRSPCKFNSLTFNPLWTPCYSCQTQWGFVGARGE